MADQPANRFRLGNITATIWKNQTNGGNSFFTVNVARSYKEGDDWKQTDSFGHGDLLNCAQVMQRAEGWIAEQQ
jgi:hypothetical protein